MLVFGQSAASCLCVGRLEEGGCCGDGIAKASIQLPHRCRLTAVNTRATAGMPTSDAMQVYGFFKEVLSGRDAVWPAIVFDV